MPFVLTAASALAADAQRGAQVFKKCAICHASGKAAEGRKKACPHLSGLFGRRAGSVDGFTYSKST